MKTVKGDTFETASRRLFGSETGAALLKKANPGLTAPLPEGVDLYAPPSTEKTPGAPADQLMIKIGGRALSLWTKATITRSLDAPPAVQIEAPWDPSREELRRTLQPFGFTQAVVLLGDTVLATGNVQPPAPFVSEDSSSISIPIHGRTAILSDCTAPASALPLGYDDQTIDKIAEALLQPFGISAQFEAEPGQTFERVEVKPGENIMPVLVKLAKQRGLVIGETPEGDALFTTAAVSGAPAAVLDGSKPPVVAIAGTFAASQYYSHVTAIAPTIVGLKGEQVTVTNPYKLGTLKPHTFEADDSGNESLQQIAEAKAARMFANMVSWEVQLATWKKPDGSLWQPGDIVKITAPGAMIYKASNLLARSVTFHQDRDRRVATLNLVLPGGFAGTIPEDLPWVE